MTKTIATPEPWRDALPGEQQIAVLPLAEVKKGAMPGWCTVANELDGPEFEILGGGVNSKKPTHAALWRQGHLLHFGFEPMPTELNANGRALLLNAIAYISRFVTDRPIVRTRSSFDPAGISPSRFWLDMFLSKGDAENLASLFAEPWAAQIAAAGDAGARAFVDERRAALMADGRRFSFDDTALRLGLDLRRVDSLTALTGELDGDHRAQALASLLRLLPGGPAADTTTNNWRNWLSSHGASLCFDPLSLCWRNDPVAQWRGSPSDGIRGPTRADGDDVRDADAVALAAKVVARHGGARALDDLRSISGRRGDIRWFWDRAHGVLRFENRTALKPGQFATPWDRIVFDTAADADIHEGGGPEPRPRVSGRGLFRDLQERLFLPLRLLEPGASLQLLDDDPSGDRRLAVRLAGRCLDPTETFVLRVAGDGSVTAIETTAGNRTVVTTIEATTAVGPLLLPARSVQKGTRRDLEFDFVDLQWNPPVPEHLADATDLILGG